MHHGGMLGPDKPRTIPDLSPDEGRPGGTRGDLLLGRFVPPTGRCPRDRHRRRSRRPRPGPASSGRTPTEGAAVATPKSASPRPDPPAADPAARPRARRPYLSGSTPDGRLAR